jgi:exonuclease III
MNLINSPSASEYMVEDEFNNLSNVNRLDSSFRIMQINIRSLIGNFYKFKSMLAQLHKSFSVIGLVETWLKDQTLELVNIPGYNFVSNHRRDKTGSGTGLYIQDNLEYKLCSDCIISDPDTIESLFVEIQVPIWGKYNCWNNLSST